MRRLSKATIAMVISVVLVLGIFIVFNVILVERESFNLESKEARVFYDGAEATTESLDINIQGKLYRKKFDIGKSIDESKFVGSTKVKGIAQIGSIKYDVVLDKTKEENFYGFLEYKESKDKYNGSIMISDYPRRVNLFNYGE